MPVFYQLNPKIREELDKREKEGTLEQLLEPWQLEVMNLVKEFLQNQKQEEIDEFSKPFQKR